MKPLTLFLLFFLAGSHFLLGQTVLNDQKAKEDSTGLVSSFLLPTVAPLLLFDEEKVKEEKKEKKKKRPVKILFLEWKQEKEIPEEVFEVKNLLNFSTTQTPHRIAILTYEIGIGTIQRNGSFEPKGIPKAKASCFMGLTNA